MILKKIIVPNIQNNIININELAPYNGVTIFNQTRYVLYVSKGTAIPHSLYYDYAVLPLQTVTLPFAGQSMTVSFNLDGISNVLSYPVVTIIFFDNFSPKSSNLNRIPATPRKNDFIIGGSGNVPNGNNFNQDIYVNQDNEFVIISSIVLNIFTSPSFTTWYRLYVHEIATLNFYPIFVNRQNYFTYFHPILLRPKTSLFLEFDNNSGATMQIVWNGFAQLYPL